jgi:hypothetical protein
MRRRACTDLCGGISDDRSYRVEVDFRRGLDSHLWLRGYSTSWIWRDSFRCSLATVLHEFGLESQK